MSRECSIEQCSKPAMGRGFCCAHYRRLRIYGSPLKGGKPHGLTKEFASEIATYAGNDCVVWPFARDRAGYGRSRWNGRDAGAHQVVCELAHGPRPTQKHEAAHSCGMGHTGCVTPKHLRWATHKENHADRAAHGTNNAGEACGSAKLREPDISVIRLEALRGVTQIALAKRFGVSSTTIRHVLAGRTWRHV